LRLHSEPAAWAISRLLDALKTKGMASRLSRSFAEESTSQYQIAIASSRSALARRFLDSARLSIPEVPEALGIIPNGSGRSLLIAGSDTRGLVYALLETADRIVYSLDPARAIWAGAAAVQRPATPIRSITRLFTSEPEDKPWFYHKQFWEKYLSMLAAERYNRFSLAFGLGYNAPRNVPDSYFYFAYPFLLSVPGYKVRARGLSDEERDRNFFMLRWIAQQTKARGLHFQLALWTHAYNFIDSPNVNYTIEGLSPENHAAYCRTALQQLLKQIPEIDGVTFRAHSESGVPEKSYDFWRAIFDGVKSSGRRVEIDIHSKGIEHKLLDMALETGLPVNVSPKFSAEHMGLPYHQASIRELERSAPTNPNASVEAQRRFTRYGYADYLHEDRRYGVLWRMWPGTQRLLLWGDPAMAAAYSRASTFAGSSGMELCEPLSFKGRMGSGSPGGREQYADPSLRPAAGDWQKYLYSYRVWGRLLYDPETHPEVWRRPLKNEIGAAAPHYEEALAQASRILPLVTTAHHPSASNNSYWPEIYTDMPIVSEKRNSYGDTPSPKRFANCGSLDPVLFSSAAEFAGEVVSNRRTGKYSPLDVAQWLEGFAEAAENHLKQAESKGPRPSAEFRRWAVDIRAQSALGRFFAEKLRAAVEFALYESRKDRPALDRAVQHYRAARAAWKTLIDFTQDAYVRDLTFGRERRLRGHWADRLAAVDADLADMEKLSREDVNPASSGAAEGSNSPAGDPQAANSTKAHGPAPVIPNVSYRAQVRHNPVQSFQRGAAVPIELNAGELNLSGAWLYYRHANQAETYRVTEMTWRF
jgi:hypothetical protein